MYNYVVTAHKPTAVSHAITCSFSCPVPESGEAATSSASEPRRDLVLAKGSRLELHTLTPDGLKPFVDVTLYGRISALVPFRPEESRTDWLFVATEEYHFCVLAFDEVAERITTKAKGDLRDRVGKPTKMRHVATVDPGGRMIGLHLYNGLFKVVPMDPVTGQLQEAFNIRFEEANVLDLAFLHGYDAPTLLVLYEERNARHLKTYTVRMREKEFEGGPWSQGHVEHGTSMLVPIPAPLGGALLLGESTMTYANGAATKTIAIDRATIPKAYGVIDSNGSRILVGDFRGELSVAVLQNDGTAVQDLSLERLGNVSSPSSIAYLDNGFVFVGSALGDSQLVRLLREPDQSGSHLEVVDRFVNLGPIVDFEVVDLDRQGQGKLVTCSGGYNDGSLRVIRNGIGLHVLAEIDVENVLGTWPLVGFEPDEEAHHSILALSFVSQTQFLFIESLEMKEIDGLEHEAQSLFCGNVAHGQIIQVTSSGVRLAKAHGCTAEWKPESGEITVVCCTDTQVILSPGSGKLCLLEIGDGSITLSTSVELGDEISSLACNHRENGSASLCAVAFWKDISVAVLEVPSLMLMLKEQLGADVMARSLLIPTFEGVEYLLCGMGDGNLISFTLTPEGVLSKRKCGSLGTQPVLLNTFRTEDGEHVIAACDRPTVVYSSNKKLLFSNVNIGAVKHASPFNAAAYQHSMLLVSETTLTIGQIDDVQKLHVKTVPLGEMPRRIAFQPATGKYCVLSIKYVVDGSGQEQERHHVHILEEQTMEIVATHELGSVENVCSVASVIFEDDPTSYFVVGTADVVPGQPEPTHGRILVFRVDEGNKLVLVAQRDARGAVYSVCGFQGKLLAAINSRVQLYRWKSGTGGESAELNEEAQHLENIVALHLATRGDFILVGDLMRSISLLSYSSVENTVQEIARDYNPNWMSSIEALDDDTFIGAESSFNLFTVRKNSEAATDEERGRLEVVGEYHLGDYVNRFRHGSLVMKMPDLKTYPTLLFGTISGAIGVVVTLSAEEFEFFSLLSKQVTKVIKGVGGFEHQSWRAFASERKTSTAPKNFIDGDLIESILELPQRRIADIASEVGISAEQLVARIESLAQATH